MGRVPSEVPEAQVLGAPRCRPCLPGDGPPDQRDPGGCPRPDPRAQTRVPAQGGAPRSHAGLPQRALGPVRGPAAGAALPTLARVGARPGVPAQAALGRAHLGGRRRANEPRTLPRKRGGCRVILALLLLAQLSGPNPLASATYTFQTGLEDVPPDCTVLDPRPECARYAMNPSVLEV